MLYHSVLVYISIHVSLPSEEGMRVLADLANMPSAAYAIGKFSRRVVYEEHCCHMVETIDFMCDTCMHIHSQYMPILCFHLSIYGICMANICPSCVSIYGIYVNLVDIFVSSTYLAVRCDYQS